MVRIETYPNHLFVPKFYLKSHSSSKNKYKILTHTKEPRNIVQTCMAILFDILRKNELASFAFVGEIGVNEKIKGKGSKRWRVYSLLMKTYVSEDRFVHLDEKNINAYIVLNKMHIQKKTNLKDEVVQMFSERIKVEELLSE